MHGKEHEPPWIAIHIDFQDAKFRFVFRNVPSMCADKTDGPYSLNYVSLRVSVEMNDVISVSQIEQEKQTNKSALNTTI